MAAAAVPDYLASPDAVFADEAEWRHGSAPDYTRTRQVWKDTKTMSHPAGSLQEMVENLVKNWEVEASFKTRLSDWRTVDPAAFRVSVNGGEYMDAEHMLRVGTYNALLTPGSMYCPARMSFEASHKTFKRMMPTFAWEVLEVYSGPPRVAFRWRHWGVMKEDYVGVNERGETVRAKAHGGRIELQGVIVAEVDDKVRLQKLDVWYDPASMFRQIAGADGLAVVSQGAEHGAEDTPGAAASLDSQTNEPAAATRSGEPKCPHASSSTS